MSESKHAAVKLMEEGRIIRDHLISEGMGREEIVMAAAAVLDTWTAGHSRECKHWVLANKAIGYSLGIALMMIEEDYAEADA